MKKLIISFVALTFILMFTQNTWVYGRDPHPLGITAEERAEKGAQKLSGAKPIKLSVLMSPLFTPSLKAMTEYTEKRLGITIDRYVEIGYTEMRQKLLSEAIGKTGGYDLIIGQPDMVPDFAGARLVRPLDDFIKKYDPDMLGYVGTMGYQYKYKGKIYGIMADADAHNLVLRKDLVEHPGERAAFKKKYGYDMPHCPDKWDEYRDMAEFFTRKKGQKLAGKTLDGDFYGAVNGRAIQFIYRAWLPRYYSMGKLPFDKDMHPTIDSPEGIKVTNDIVEMSKFMHHDIMSWATPQVLPFYHQGHAFSTFWFPGVIHAFDRPDISKVAGFNLGCQTPGYVVDGKLIRATGQTAGFGFMIPAYSKHAEAADLLAQFLTSETFSPTMVGHPKSFWDPYRISHFKTNNLVNMGRYTRQFLDEQYENVLVAGPMLPIEGSEEYYKALDKTVQAVMLGQMSAAKAMKRVARMWEDTTEDIGRKGQAEVWRGVVKDFYPPHLQLKD